jgi:hypothetical protein
MAAFFLVLAVAVGVVIGDAVIANTSASNLQLFDQTITGFTQGQLLIIAAGAGFLFAMFLFLAFGSSKNRRTRRRERRDARRDMEGRIGQLERENTGLRENAGLRENVDRDRRTTRLDGMAEGDDTHETQVSRRIFPHRNDSLEERAARAEGRAPNASPEEAERERANNR